MSRVSESAGTWYTISPRGLVAQVYVAHKSPACHAVLDHDDQTWQWITFLPRIANSATRKRMSLIWHTDTSEKERNVYAESLVRGLFGSSPEIYGGATLAGPLTMIDSDTVHIGTLEYDHIVAIRMYADVFKEARK